MFLSIITEIIKGLIIGMGSYGSKTFPDPLKKEEEEKEKIRKKDEKERQEQKKKKQENKKTPKTGENPEPQANIKTEEF